jgi:hypothetical protein
MQSSLIAAAGLAEAAWMMAMWLMEGGLFVICLIAVFALTARSQMLAITAIVLLGLFTVFFQPWHCFMPLDAEARRDPDVVSAAEDSRVVVAGWILTSLLTVTSLVVTWRRM